MNIKLHWMCNGGDNPLLCSNLFDAPDPPNPIQTASAQTATNVNTAVANAWLGNVNQQTPTGSLNYNQTGTQAFTDPATGHVYAIPTFTAVQSLSPNQQTLQNQNEQAQINLSGLAGDQSQFLRSYLNQPFGISGAPGAGNADWLNTGDAALGFGEGGPITRDYGDFAGERNRIEEGLMQRLSPQLQQERQRYETQLADQGIRYGSAAYTNAMDNYNRQATDARLGVIGQAGEEQQRMSDIAAQRAGFQNAAQQQAFTQASLRGQFYNAGLAQRQQQAQSRFNAANVGRQQWLNEQTMLRNQPINEITALLSGSQVSNPNFVNANMPTIPTTDIAGIIGQNYNQQLAAHQSESGAWQNLIGGVLGLGGNIARGMSDRRVKKNIERLGTVFAENQEGESEKLPIYKFSYKGDPAERTFTGPMAQDVEKIDPSAVQKIGGIRHIDLPKLGSILKAA